MPAMIISGKEVAAQLRSEMTEEVAQIKENGKADKHFCPPGLAVIQVGNDPASSIYVSNKKKACEQVGIMSFGYSLDVNAKQEELIDLIDTLNKDPRVHGILCQLPLPRQMDEFAVICAIAPEKDVDGFHPVNKGLLSIGRECLVSCTPLGCLSLIKSSGIPIAGKHCVVIGRSNIVGKPVSQLMLAESATVTITHSRTKDLPAVCREADILIAAIGKQGFVTADFVKPGAVVIDVGINRCADGKVRGDVDFDSVYPVAGAITPVPGGVGPMTITMLLKNTIHAYKNLTGRS